jgi:UDP-3-O-[3-hydroxymyristoyl] N-acetylglucosamine deacetylase
MLKIYQQTLNKPISFEGVGLHSGKECKIKILPGKADSGIVFKRVDLKENNLVHANYKNVSSAKLCTTLKNENGVKISTVEHLLAALYISEIDNAIIEINSEEIPIMDGSAKDFLSKLNKVEIKELTKKRKYLKIVDSFEFVDGSRKISIEPNDLTFEVGFQLNYNNKIIGNQKNKINFQKDDLEEIIESRTFCLYEDIEKIKQNGLAKGGSLDNALVVDDEKVINKDGLRNDKEFVNHKILDLAGDFLLSGSRVLGKVTCHQGGHQLTNTFLRKMFATSSVFTSLELKDIIISKKISTNQSIKLAVSA